MNAIAPTAAATPDAAITRRGALPRDQPATPRTPIRAVRETLSDIAASGITSAAIRNAPTPISAKPCDARIRSSCSQNES